MARPPLSLVGLALLGWCTPERDGGNVGPEPVVAPAPATLRRLTHAQYVATLDDVFGPGPRVAAVPRAGRRAGRPVLGRRGSGRALALRRRTIRDGGLPRGGPGARRPRAPQRRRRVRPRVAECLGQVVEQVGRRLYRRTLTAEERASIVALGEAAAAALHDPDEGVDFALAALLQSPNFLYRVELGDGGVFTGTELASRMAFLLWGGPPDDALLDQAESGALDDPESAARRPPGWRPTPGPRRGRGAWPGPRFSLTTKARPWWSPRRPAICCWCIRSMTGSPAPPGPFPRRASRRLASPSTSATT